MMTFNAMRKQWIGRLAAVRLTFRRLPSVASGQYYEDVFTQAGYTLAIPCFGLKNGVHLSHRVSESRSPRLGDVLPHRGLVSVLLLRPTMGRTQDAPTSRQKLQTRRLRLEEVEHAVAV